MKKPADLLSMSIESWPLSVVSHGLLSLLLNFLSLQSDSLRENRSVVPVETQFRIVREATELTERLGAALIVIEKYIEFAFLPETKNIDIRRTEAGSEKRKRGIFGERGIYHKKSILFLTPVWVNTVRTKNG